MVRAIQFSSNTCFYSLGWKWAWIPSTTSWHLQLGQTYQVDLGGEVRVCQHGLEARCHKRPETRRWYQGETVSLGIGQGYNNFTMLQLALAQATLVNGGIRYRPHVGKAVRNAVHWEDHPIEQPPGQQPGLCRQKH